MKERGVATMAKKRVQQRSPASVENHPSPIYKHVPGGGIVKCVWNPDENEYDCGPIDYSDIPNGAGIFPVS
jgi:hypothetical protein